MHTYKEENILNLQKQDRIKYTMELLKANGMSYHHRLLALVSYPSSDKNPVYYGQ